MLRALEHTISLKNLDRFLNNNNLSGLLDQLSQLASNVNLDGLLENAKQNVQDVLNNQDLQDAAQNVLDSGALSNLFDSDDDDNGFGFPFRLPTRRPGGLIVG